MTEGDSLLAPEELMASRPLPMEPVEMSLEGLAN